MNHGLRRLGKGYVLRAAYRKTNTGLGGLLRAFGLSGAGGGRAAPLVQPVRRPISAAGWRTRPDANGDSMGLGIRATRDVQMADIGDRVQVASTKVGQAPRDGVVTGVIGSLLRVKWSTGEESTFAPKMGSLIVVGRARSGSKRRSSPVNARTGTTKAGAAKSSATKTAQSTRAAKKAASAGKRPTTRATRSATKTAKSTPTAKKAASAGKRPTTRATRGR